MPCIPLLINSSSHSCMCMFNLVHVHIILSYHKIRVCVSEGSVAFYQALRSEWGGPSCSFLFLHLALTLKPPLLHAMMYVWQIYVYHIKFCGSDILWCLRVLVSSALFTLKMLCWALCQQPTAKLKKVPNYPRGETDTLSICHVMHQDVK